jgi:signal transduction histidine kinase
VDARERGMNNRPPRIHAPFMEVSPAVQAPARGWACHLLPWSPPVYARQMPPWKEPVEPAPPDAAAMPPVRAASTVKASPLLHAALVLVPPSATPAELERRFAASGASLGPHIAARLLDDLADLGLIRATQRTASGARFVATSLGTRYASEGLHGEAGIPLAELENLRTDLLSTIAHELRTPLTAVRTSAGLLLDPASEPTDEQRRALLEAIQRNGERMQRLVGDILELSRFRSGSVSLQLRRFSANALADSAIAVVAPLALRRGQRVERSHAPSGDHRVYGDHRRLEQALLNLVSNAERFAPDGGTISVSVEEHGLMTSWSATDDGPGIPEADRARLFERFFVGRNDRSGPREGIGLGLPTALAIAQAHGGTIEVRSEVGRGSTFTLVVPTSGPDDEP